MKLYNIYNGTTVREKFEYDLLGNPVIYRNRTLSWQGRRLLSYANREYSVNYTYDVDGIRTSKHAITPVGEVNIIIKHRNPIGLRCFFSLFYNVSTPQILLDRFLILCDTIFT